MKTAHVFGASHQRLTTALDREFRTLDGKPPPSTAAAAALQATCTLVDVHDVGFYYSKFPVGVLSLSLAADVTSKYVRARPAGGGGGSWAVGDFGRRVTHTARKLIRSSPPPRSFPPTIVLLAWWRYQPLSPLSGWRVLLLRHTHTHTVILPITARASHRVASDTAAQSSAAVITVVVVVVSESNSNSNRSRAVGCHVSTG